MLINLGLNGCHWCTNWGRRTHALPQPSAAYSLPSLWRKYNTAPHSSPLTNLQLFNSILFHNAGFHMLALASTACACLLAAHKSIAKWRQKDTVNDKDYSPQSGYWHHLVPSDAIITSASPQTTHASKRLYMQLCQRPSHTRR